MVALALIIKEAIVRRSIFIPLMALSLSGCTLIHQPEYVDQSPGMTDMQLSLCLSNSTTSDAQRADCQREKNLRTSAPPTIPEHLTSSLPSVPQYRMNPILNDGQWHSFEDKNIEYRKTDESDEYPSLYIKYQKKGGEIDLGKELFDCSANKSKIESSVSYSKNGNVIGSSNSGDSPWYDVLPNTNDAAALFQACMKII